MKTIYFYKTKCDLYSIRLQEIGIENIKTFLKKEYFGGWREIIKNHLDKEYEILQKYLKDGLGNENIISTMIYFNFIVDYFHAKEDSLTIVPMSEISKLIDICRNILYDDLDRNQALSKYGIDFMNIHYSFRDTVRLVELQLYSVLSIDDYVLMGIK